MWNDKKVVVVFPAYNEQENISSAVEEFRSVTLIDASPIVDEVIVIDNNSSDNTATLAKKAGASILTETKQGYGNALQRGLREARGDIIITCEPDGTFVAQDIIKLLSYADDFDMVCGTRTTRELFWKEANMGFFLRWGNFAVAKLLELLYGTCSLSDCGCTFRLYKRETIDRIKDDLFVGGSHFLPNAIIAVRMQGMSFIEIPVNYRGRVGESKITGNLWGVWKTGLAMIWLIISMWPSFVVQMARGQAMNSAERDS